MCRWSPTFQAKLETNWSWEVLLLGLGILNPNPWPNFIILIFPVIFRYSAVCQPYTYRRENRSKNVNLRVLKYLLLVIITSILVNAPRFFETKLIIESVNVSIGDSFETQTRYSYTLSSLRKNLHYIKYKKFVFLNILIFWLTRFYINWFRLIFTGLLPGMAIIVFNYKIFRGIRL